MRLWDFATLHHLLDICVYIQSSMDEFYIFFCIFHHFNKVKLWVASKRSTKAEWKFRNKSFYFSAFKGKHVICELCDDMNYIRRRDETFHWERFFFYLFSCLKINLFIYIIFFFYDLMGNDIGRNFCRT